MSVPNGEIRAEETYQFFKGLGVTPEYKSILIEEEQEVIAYNATDEESVEP